jgi:hypothetical protein
VYFHLILEVYIQLHEAVILTSQPPEYIGLHTLKCSGTSGCKALPDLVLTQVSVCCGIAIYTGGETCSTSLNAYVKG